MSSQSQLHALLATDLLESLQDVHAASGPASRSHPSIPAQERGSAAAFWLKHKVAGLVARRYTFESLVAALGAEAAQGLRAEAVAYQRKALVFQQALRSALQAGQTLGLWMMPFKGVMDAQDLYGDPGARFCGDLDVLVPRQQLEVASQLLSSLGYHEIGVSAKLSPRAKRWWLRVDHSMEWKNPHTGVAIDLHWRMNDLPLVQLDDEGWFRAAALATCWGVPCMRLGPVERYVALLTHAERSQWVSLRWWADLGPARALAIEQLGESAFETALQRQRALDLDRIWLAARQQLSAAMRQAPSQASPAARLLSPQPPTPLENVQSALRLRENFRYRALWLQRHALSWEDVSLLRLPDSLFPLYFPMRPLLTGFRLLRAHSERTKTK